MSKCERRGVCVCVGVGMYNVHGATWGGAKTTKTEQTDNNQGKKVKSICAVRESNPKLNLGRVSCYHYTNGAGDDDATFLRNTY